MKMWRNVPDTQGRFEFNLKGERERTELVEVLIFPFYQLKSFPRVCKSTEAVQVYNYNDTACHSFFFFLGP